MKWSTINEYHSMMEDFAIRNLQSEIKTEIQTIMDWNKIKTENHQMIAEW